MNQTTTAVTFRVRTTDRRAGESVYKGSMLTLLPPAESKWGAVRGELRGEFESLDDMDEEEEID